MTTINAVGNGLAGATGTGSFVGSTSPTLITPTLGVANATSINFGGSTLDTYQTSTVWTPTFTFATPGDISVMYSSQIGRYTRIGNIVYIVFAMQFTPTYTTSAGDVHLTGIPFNVGVVDGYGSFLTGNSFPAGTTSLLCAAAATHNYVLLLGIGSGTTPAQFTVTQFPTGVASTIQGSVIYMI